jgi:Spy/CpxP family protein refolding chaperone
MMWRLVSRFGKPALVLSIALLFLQGADAQPGRRKGDDTPAKEEAKASPELEAWIKTLTEKMTDRQDSIRDSARAALVSIGRPALPELQKLADGKDAATAEAAKQVIARIERGGRNTGGPGGFPGGPGGFPGRPGGTDDNPRRPGGGTGPGNNSPPVGAGMVDRALRDLDLSDKQKAKLEDIKTAQQKKLADLAEKAREGKLDGDELRKTFEKNREEMIKDIEAVLTRDQIDKFEKALKDATPPNPGDRNNPGNRPGGPGGGPGGGRGGPGGFGGGFGQVRGLTQALKDLDLSEKQQAKVDKIMDAQQDKMRDLTAKLRDGKLDRDEMRTAFEKVQEDLIKDIKDILTKDQADKLDKALKDAERGGNRGGPGGGPGGGRGGPGGGFGGRPGR